MIPTTARVATLTAISRGAHTVVRTIRLGGNRAMRAPEGRSRFYQTLGQEWRCGKTPVERRQIAVVAMRASS